MKFNDRYEILDLVATNAESTTFSARDLTRQSPVMIHVIPAHSESATALVDLARRHTGLDRPVLEVGECKGAPFIATSVIPEFRTLREWLQSVPQAGTDSEFTKMFRSFEQVSPAPPAKGASRNPPPAALDSVVDQQPESRREVGDFTRMFQAPKNSEAAPQRPDNSWVPKLEWSESSMTAEKEYPLQAPPVTPPPPAPVESGPSEFTRVVARPQPKPVEEAPPPAPAQPAAAPAPVAAPGPSYLPVILTLAGLFLVAVIVVLYFALKN